MPGKISAPRTEGTSPDLFESQKGLDQSDRTDIGMRLPALMPLLGIILPMEVLFGWSGAAPIVSASWMARSAPQWLGGSASPSWPAGVLVGHCIDTGHACAKLARAVSVVCYAMLWRSSSPARLHRAMPADQRSHGADPAAEAEAEGKIA
jgi:hypothetical protein